MHHQDEAPAGRSWRDYLSVPQVTPLRAASVLAGAVAVQASPGLPAAGISLLVALLALLALFTRAGNRWPIWFLLGFSWTLLRADAVLQARLPDSLHGRDFEVVGNVRELPQASAHSTRFAFDIDSARLDGAMVPLQGAVRLNWYANAPLLRPCSRWALTVRLRPPRGLVNPGGNDSERSAAQRGLVAVGYVRDAPANQALDETSLWCIDQLRATIGQSISAHEGVGSMAPLLRALAVGDQSGISEADWQVLRATGIGHLISISGLHVGMFAAFGALLARLLWKLLPRLTLRVPAPLLEAPAAMLCALAYGLLAGMGLPTVRTLIMIAVALLARYARRGRSVPQALALAALAIMLWDPLSVLSAGFWLSFAGVAVLLSMTTPVLDETPVWREMPRVQLLLSTALLPLTVWFFGQGSLIGPLANLLAVPWVSFVVVPVTVAASLLLAVAPVIGEPLLQLAGWLLAPLWWLMEWMAALPFAQQYFAAAPAWALALALLGIGWCLLPRGVPGRALGLLLVLPMLLPQQMALRDGEFESWTFDVGQGLSVLVRTRDHVLVYDAGPRYPSGFDLGDVAIVPSLLALGIDHVDRLVISHGDNDHAGGATSVHLAFPDARIESGEPQRVAALQPALLPQPCRAGDAWQWNGVRFRTVSPPAGAEERGNDSSCVIVVEGAHGSLVLTGDASRQVEPMLAENIGPLPRPRVLNVPHHGSKTGSSAVFLDALEPDLALVSAGHRNRFGHPHADVTARYAEREIELLNTAEHGYLHLRFVAEPQPVQRGREVRRAWWRQP